MEEDWRQTCGSTPRRPSAMAKSTWMSSETGKYAVMEAIDWVCTRVQDNHGWMSEFSKIMRENKILEALNCVLDVRCTVQWEMLWYSSPTSFSNDLLMMVSVSKSTTRRTIWPPIRPLLCLSGEDTRQGLASWEHIVCQWSGFLGAHCLTMDQCMHEWREGPAWEMLGWDPCRQIGPTA